MRQLTSQSLYLQHRLFSKLPMRQLTHLILDHLRRFFSKLPMRQLTGTPSLVTE